MPRIQVRYALDVVEIDVRIVAASVFRKNKSGPRHDMDQIDDTVLTELEHYSEHLSFWPLSEKAVFFLAFQAVPNRGKRAQVRESLWDPT